MIPTNNILDQLLGGFETSPPGSVTGLGTKNPGADSLFASLLGEYLVPQKSFDPALILGQPEVVVNNSTTTENGQLASQRLENTQTVVPENISDSNPAIPYQLTMPVPGDVPTAAISQEANFHLPQMPAGHVLKPELIEQNQAKTATVNAMSLDWRPELTLPTPDLSTAVLRVNQSRVEDGQLKLTLAPSEEATNSQPIELSIPLKSLTPPEQSDARWQPLPASGFGESDKLAMRLSTPDQVDFSKLIDHLKVRAIEIDNQDVRSALKVTPQPVTIKLVTDQSGLPTIINAELPLHEARKLVSLPNEKATLTEQTEEKINVTRQPFEPAEKITPHPDPVRVEESKSYSKLFAESGGDSSKTHTRETGNHHELPSHDTFRLDLESKPVQVSTKEAPDLNGNRIRLTIEDLSPDRLRTDSRSIMIRIEPESLGPARLNLHMNHSQLTARITVDTIAAKTAVEHSLDQLTSQLNRAGINVDRIEVNLSGGNLQQNFLGHRPSWANRVTSSGHKGALVDQVEESAEAASQPMIQSQDYAPGINLLA